MCCVRGTRAVSRTAGPDIERIIARMKELANEAGLPSYAPPPQANRVAIIQRIVRLCIEQYYGA